MQYFERNRIDAKVRPRPSSGLSIDDVLTWLDHFENVATYHQWHDEREAMEVRTLLEGVAATWLIQHSKQIKDLLEALLQAHPQTHFQQQHPIVGPLQAVGTGEVWPAAGADVGGADALARCCLTQHGS
ncbi:hypothetical protein L7F22_022397 [Adiantum nelumboides]|nr:hypothetical protein [Adiantum nelumboides]